MKVYVASRFSPEGIKHVREMYELLKEFGHEITHDWTQENVDGLSGGAMRGYLTSAANRDLVAVRECNALIFINIDDVRLRGAYVEFGAALGLGKHVIVVGATPGTLEMPGSCIFFMLPYVYKVQTKEEAVAILGTLECQESETSWQKQMASSMAKGLLSTAR